MGLLDSLLEVPERLRVWQMAGVRHFYIDPEVAVSAGLPAAGASPGDEPAASARPSAVDTPPLPKAARLNETPARPATACLDETAFQAVAAQDAATCPALPADPACWPDPWPALFAKAPARPRLVITYRELGLDLTGQADPRRGGLWRTLLRDLHLAGKNAVAFWPFALPVNNVLTEFPDHFAAGLTLLAPSVVAVFGPLPPAVAAALPAGDQPQPVIEQLPHPEQLLASDPEAWDHVCTTLSRLL